MEARAVNRYVRQSPRKLRLVLDEVRGEVVGAALNYLHFSPLKASGIVEQTLRSAVANWLQKATDSKQNPDDLKITRAYADGGPFVKRFRPASMGRVSRLNKPTSHLTIVVSNEEE